MKENGSMRIKNLTRPQRGRGRPLKNVKPLGYRIPLSVDESLKVMLAENGGVFNSKSHLITCALAHAVEEGRSKEGLSQIVESSNRYFRRERARAFSRVKKSRLGK